MSIVLVSKKKFPVATKIKADKKRLDPAADPAPLVASFAVA